MKTNTDITLLLEAANEEAKEGMTDDVSLIDVWLIALDVKSDDSSSALLTSSSSSCTSNEFSSTSSSSSCLLTTSSSCCLTCTDRSSSSSSELNYNLVITSYLIQLQS